MTSLRTIPQAAKGLSLSEQQLARLVRSGEARGEKVGRDWVLDVAEVKRLEREYPLGLAAGDPQ